MKNICITGGSGLLGQHLRFYLAPLEESGAVKINLIQREDWADARRLGEQLRAADVLVHLAGMNRGGDTEIYDANLGLANSLIERCEADGLRPHIIYSSSTHEVRDTGYGRSKRDVGALLDEWGKRVHAPVTVFILPHVFGEFAKPFHNSGIATLCHQISEGEPSEVNPEGEFELVHARDVAALIYEAIAKGTSGRVRVAGQRISVQDVYALLVGFASTYRHGDLPALESRLESQLFMTLHSVLAWKHMPFDIPVSADGRGELFEVIRGAGRYQVSYSRSNPGAVRGNHYHTRKIERFCIVEGSAEVRMRRMLTNETVTFSVDGSDPIALDTPTYWTHSIHAVGPGPLSIVFWTSEPFDPKDPDTFRAET